MSQDYKMQNVRPETTEDRKASMCEKFQPELQKLIERRTHDKSKYYYISDQKCSQVIGDLKAIEENGFTSQKNDSTRYNQEKRIWNRLEVQVQTFGEKTVERLRDKRTGKAYMKNSQIFDLLWEAHHSLGHAKRDAMIKELNRLYENVSREAIEAFLPLCRHCELKRSRPKKTIVVKPIVSNHMNSRGQVDLIDYQSIPDGDYKFILNYQDHLTKFVSLRPLKQKTAKEVAWALVEIFGTFGAPTLLHSDNGKEFSNKLINEFEIMWPGLKVVHGTPRHSQSQGSVERANQDIENRVACALSDNNTTHWAKLLPMIQFQKNSTLHAGIGRTPYEGMFGTVAKNGLSGSQIPPEILKTIQTEDDLKNATEEQEMISENPSGSNACDFCSQKTVRKCTVCEKVCCNLCGTEVDGEGGSECPLCCKATEAKSHREGAKRKQEDQAEKMLQRSAKRFKKAEVGDNVTVKIPDVDRGRGDFRSVMAVVLEVDNERGVKLGTEDGIFKNLFQRSMFSVLQRNDFITPEMVPKDKEISVRQAATAASMGHGQGMVKCGCKTSCEGNKCTCRKMRVLCNSRCHNSLACGNK